MKITELLAWLESKAPYSTAEGDRRHAEIAALVRAAQAEIDRLTAENERLLEVLRNLLERVDRNGGLGEYKGGKAFAVSDARAALNQEEKP